MDNIRSAIGYLGHRLQSRRWDAFHSPYLFRLFTTCIDTADQPEIFQILEANRKQLLASKDVLVRQDFGAGSRQIKTSPSQKLADITSNAASLPFQCRFLAHLVRFSSSRYVLELGTSVGLSAAYMASLSPEAQIVTVEGDPTLVEYAQQLFSRHQLSNITVIESTFAAYLSSAVSEMPSLDLLFMDGHHASEPLWTYYQSLRPRFHSGTIVVVDDIHWSADMQRGWEKLISQPEVTQSVDAYHFGLLFFHPDFMDKAHHKIHFPLLTLWR